MKTIIYGLKNWKTSLLGIIVAILVVWQDFGGLEKVSQLDWKAFATAAVIAVWGVLSRDADKSSKKTGVDDK